VVSDTETATWAIFLWLCIKTQIGSSLDTLEADSLLYFKQMKALKRDQVLSLTQALRQAYLNLLGRNNIDNPTHFPGDVLSEEELERFRANPFFGPVVDSFHGMLLVYFGDYVRYADLVIQMGHDSLQKAWFTSPFNMWDTLLKGVSCFAAAQETRKKKYAKMGQRFRMKYKKWLSMGNPNLLHYDALLDAEFMAFKGNKKNAAIKYYETAIMLAVRGGYQQDAALATERCGAFYLTVMGDRENATYQIGQSMTYWREWGAISKVHHLQEKYADLMPRPSEVSVRNMRI
jgi:hypothetical protein